ncbi:hypothetical protein [Streptomyces sp. SID3343]|uniref:hypothetical protein n=1 Tax=Streptomyces sp. SID3343 TaxID=2690260 RepID=UPI00136BEC02|nr:hypothetical protein [Streptomyces sp. SID3343]MYV97449.1 hypothetical protein [Streptomyces sp. SID3343]
MSFPMPGLIRVAADDPDAFAEAVDRVQPDAARVPLVLGGGRSAALAATSAPASYVPRPEHGLITGAFGAAPSPVGGAHERVMWAGEAAREDAAVRMLLWSASGAGVSAGRVRWFAPGVRGRRAPGARPGQVDQGRVSSSYQVIR